MRLCTFVFEKESESNIISHNFTLWIFKLSRKQWKWGMFVQLQKLWSVSKIRNAFAFRQFCYKMKFTATKEFKTFYWSQSCVKFEIKPPDTWNMSGNFGNKLRLMDPDMSPSYLIECNVFFCGQKQDASKATMNKTRRETKTVRTRRQGCWTHELMDNSHSNNVRIQKDRRKFSKRIKSPTSSSSQQVGPNVQLVTQFFSHTLSEMIFSRNSPITKSTHVPKVHLVSVATSISLAIRAYWNPRITQMSSKKAQMRSLQVNVALPPHQRVAHQKKTKFASEDILAQRPRPEEKSSTTHSVSSHLCALGCAGNCETKSKVRPTSPTRWTTCSAHDVGTRQRRRWPSRCLTVTSGQFAHVQRTHIQIVSRVPTEVVNVTSSLIVVLKAFELQNPLASLPNVLRVYALPGANSASWRAFLAKGNPLNALSMFGAIRSILRATLSSLACLRRLVPTVDVDMFFLFGPNVTGYEVDTRQEPTKLFWFFLFSWIVSDKRVRKMMITKIVSMKFFFRHNAHKWHLRSANWLVGLESTGIRIKCYTSAWNGPWQLFTTKQDNTEQEAEMTKRWSLVTNRRYFRRHGSPCKCPRRWGPHSSLPWERWPPGDKWSPFGTLARFRTPLLPGRGCPGHWLVPFFCLARCLVSLRGQWIVIMRASESPEK